MAVLITTAIVVANVYVMVKMTVKRIKQMYKRHLQKEKAEEFKRDYLHAADGGQVATVKGGAVSLSLRARIARRQRQKSTGLRASQTVWRARELDILDEELDELASYDAGEEELKYCNQHHVPRHRPQ